MFPSSITMVKLFVVKIEKNYQAYYYNNYAIELTPHKESKDFFIVYLCKKMPLKYKVSYFWRQQRGTLTFHQTSKRAFKMIRLNPFSTKDFGRVSCKRVKFAKFYLQMIFAQFQVTKIWEALFRRVCGPSLVIR